MGKLLFAENARSKKTFRKRLSFVLPMVASATAIVAALAVGIAFGGDSFTAGLIAIAGFVPLAFLIAFNLFLNKYIFVYEDRIVCKKAISKEKTYGVSPDDYVLKIIPVYVKNAKQVKLVFCDKDGKTFLKYKSSLVMPSYDELKNAWEYDILSIGCRIIDETWEIKK